MFFQTEISDVQLKILNHAPTPKIRYTEIPLLLAFCGEKGERSTDRQRRRGRDRQTVTDNDRGTQTDKNRD